MKLCENLCDVHLLRYPSAMRAARWGPSSTVSRIPGLAMRCSSCGWAHRGTSRLSSASLTSSSSPGMPWTSWTTTE
eukprot:5215777-Pyramimonas_sp.AAC.1